MWGNLESGRPRSQGSTEWDSVARSSWQGISTAPAGVVAGGIVVVINPNLAAYGVFYFFWDILAFHIIIILLVACFVIGKLSSYFEFIDAHWDHVESGPEVTSSVWGTMWKLKTPISFSFRIVFPRPLFGFISLSHNLCHPWTMTHFRMSNPNNNYS